ncbi:MAG: hypothetical protein AAB965_01505 [Patescibacteria group bacterium]
MPDVGLSQDVTVLLSQVDDSSFKEGKEVQYLNPCRVQYVLGIRDKKALWSRRDEIRKLIQNSANQRDILKSEWVANDRDGFQIIAKMEIAKSEKNLQITREETRLAEIERKRREEGQKIEEKKRKKEEVSRLIEEAKSPGEWIAVPAIEKLGFIGSDARAAIPVLYDLAVNGEYGILSAAVTALYKIDPEHADKAVRVRQGVREEEEENLLIKCKKLGKIKAGMTRSQVNTMLDGFIMECGVENTVEGLLQVCTYPAGRDRYNCKALNPDKITVFYKGDDILEVRGSHFLGQ